MEASYYIGIDISRQRLDWQVTDAQNTECATGQTENSPKGIHKMIDQWKQGKISLDELIVCFEHTGPYGLLLAALLEESGYLLRDGFGHPGSALSGHPPGKIRSYWCPAPGGIPLAVSGPVGSQSLALKNTAGAAWLAAVAGKAGQDANGPNQWSPSKYPYQQSSRSWRNKRANANSARPIDYATKTGRSQD